MRIAWILPLVACELGERADTGECPPGEVCSDGTPNGLLFSSASLSDVLIDIGPHPTLAGGTQDIHLEYKDRFGRWEPLDLPYLADDTDARGVEVLRTEGPVVTLRGVADASNYLRITDLDGTLFDRKKLDGATLSVIRIVPTHLEHVVPGASVAFAAGPVALTVALIGATGERAIDQSMTLTLDGSTRTRWDSLTIPDAAAGRYGLGVVAGGRPEVSIFVDVFDAPDEIIAQTLPQPLVAAQPAHVCFSARAGGHDHIAGLDWTYAADSGTAQPGLFVNCAMVTPAQAGPIAVTATAGGRTVTATFVVEAAAPARHAAPAPPARTPEGERAAAHAASSL